MGYEVAFALYFKNITLFLTQYSQTSVHERLGS